MKIWNSSDLYMHRTVMTVKSNYLRSGRALKKEKRRAELTF